MCRCQCFPLPNGVRRPKLSAVDSTSVRRSVQAHSPGESMNAERLTTKSREVITSAVANATQRGHATVEPWHLLLALLDTGGSTATGLLRAVGANPADLRRAAVRAVENQPAAPGPRGGGGEGPPGGGGGGRGAGG